LFSLKTKTALLGSGRPRRRPKPSNPPPEREQKGKDTKVSSLARISYGAQELAVYPPCRFTFHFAVVPVSESKQAIAFANTKGW
jgi:hypothetical protein